MKLNKTVSAALCCAVAIMSFASCGKKLDAVSSQPQSQSTPQSQSQSQLPAREPGFYPDGVKKDISTVGKVGDADVSFDNFRYYFLTVCNNMQASGELDIAKAKEQIITAFKQSAALQTMAKELNLTFTEDEEKRFDEYLESQKSRFTTEDEYKDALKQSFLTEELLMSQVRESELFVKIFGLNFMDDIKKNVEDNYVHVKHILVQFPENATDEQKAETKTKADDIAKKLADGAVFEDMMKEYNEDPGQDEAGYYFTHGKMVKAFEEKSFAMQIGEISEPVLTDYGYHIIKKYEFEPEEVEKNYSNYASEETIQKFYDLVDAKIKTIEFTPGEDWDKFTFETVS